MLTTSDIDRLIGERTLAQLTGEQIRAVATLKRVILRKGKKVAALQSAQNRVAELELDIAKFDEQVEELSELIAQ